MIRVISNLTQNLLHQSWRRQPGQMIQEKSVLEREAIARRGFREE